MTYEKLFELKFRRGYSTNELMQRFPGEAEKVREIALLQLPTGLLRKIVSESEVLEKLLSLKRRFFGPSLETPHALRTVSPERLPSA